MIDSTTFFPVLLSNRNPDQLSCNTFRPCLQQRSNRKYAIHLGTRKIRMFVAGNYGEVYYVGELNYIATK